MIPPRGQSLAWGIIVSIGAFTLTLIFAKLQRIRAEDLGVIPTRWSFLTLLGGCAIGILIFATQYAVMAPLVGLHLTRAPPISFSAITLSLITTLSLAWMEELGFRGYALRRLEGPFGVWGGQIIVAIAFELCHRLIYSGWNWRDAMIGTTTGSLLFGMAAIASRGLALPIGIHAGYNAITWAMGTKGTAGIWSLAVNPAASPGWRSQVGNATYIGSIELATLVLWLWHRRSIKLTTSAHSSLDQAVAGSAG